MLIKENPKLGPKLQRPKKNHFSFFSWVKLNFSSVKGQQLTALLTFNADTFLTYYWPREAILSAGRKGYRRPTILNCQISAVCTDLRVLEKLTRSEWHESRSIMIAIARYTLFTQTSIQIVSKMEIVLLILTTLSF